MFQVSKFFVHSIINLNFLPKCRNIGFQTVNSSRQECWDINFFSEIHDNNSHFGINKVNQLLMVYQVECQRDFSKQCRASTHNGVFTMRSQLRYLA